MPILEALVGLDGARALEAAAARQPALREPTLLRALLSWVDLASRSGYDGNVPGSDVGLELVKTETGLTGEVSTLTTQYSFVDATAMHVSAAVAALAGVAALAKSEISDEQLVRLGASVDVLVKTQVLLTLSKKESDVHFEHERDESKTPPTLTVFAMRGDKEEAKVVLVDKGLFVVRSWTVPPEIESKMRDAIKSLTGMALEKAADEESNATEGPGPAHKPTAAAGPLEPVAPTRKQQALPRQRKKKIVKPEVAPAHLPKIPGLPRLKLSEAQLSLECPVCRGTHINAGRFVGCFCFATISADTTLEKSDSNYVLSFGASWTESDVVSLLGRVKQ